MQHQYSIINISSIEWIRLQFWPTNPTSTRAMHYNDDKHKVLIGEGAATSTAVIDVPTIIEDSFYYGNVFVSYKDTVFQPSNANRRATAFFNAIQTHYISHIPPILCLYTDNGHTTFGCKSCRANHVKDDHDIDDFFKIILEIDKSLNAFETTAELLSRKKDLQITLLIMLIILFHQYLILIVIILKYLRNIVLMAVIEPPAILTNTKVRDIIQCFHVKNSDVFIVKKP
ncbi:hypothetical protein GLOIN_2v1778764 [Rhizophagus irregularis DAOM 181602=DAOM 197198]|nr:hypothetical protein GLOIN_2v1778764 [Rhizophagus irregularis DAOM 181602=DAOM 197198]